MSGAATSTVEYRNACRRCVREVRGAEISSQFDFRRWALRNHPDKGGDVEEFQKMSECVDMVYRDSCLDQIRDWDRSRRSVRDLARTEAVVASIVQSASACDIESVAVEAIPWVGRWRMSKGRKSDFHRTQGISLRLGHKRLLGIPLRLYSDLEARVHVDRQKNLENLSVGPNWTIPGTRGRLSLNVSSTSKCTTESPYLSPKTLDVSARLKIGSLSLEVGGLLDTKAKYFPRPRELRPAGFAVSVKVDLMRLSTRDGVSVFGFRGGSGPAAAEKDRGPGEDPQQNVEEGRSEVKSSEVGGQKVS